LDDHKHRTEQRNMIVLAISIRRQRKRYLMEKLRRLEAREAPQVVAQQKAPLMKKDLFS
jgi:hypothetical protein